MPNLIGDSPYMDQESRALVFQRLSWFGRKSQESTRRDEGMNTYSSEYVGCNRLLGYKT